MTRATISVETRWVWNGCDEAGPRVAEIFKLPGSERWMLINESGDNAYPAYLPVMFDTRKKCLGWHLAEAKRRVEDAKRRVEMIEGWLK